MKNVSAKLIAGVAVLGLAGAVYSFTADNTPDQPAQKKYEVIRMVNGELMEFDTIVSNPSEYTPEDYLSDLGFSEDKNINILDLSSFDHNHFIELHEEDVDVKDGKKVVIIEMDEDVEINGDGEQEIIIEKRMIDENGNEIVIEEGEEEDVIIENVIIDENGDIVKPEGSNQKEIRIEKKVMITKDGEEEIEMEVEAYVEDLNIDSLIQLAMEMEGGDSANVFVHKVMVIDEEGNGEKMEWQEMDTDGADYHKKVDGPNHHMEVAVWGDEGEDFTMVIVTDPSNPSTKAPTSAKVTNKSNVKLFPNPATTNSQLQFSFDKKAETSVVITDIQGKVMANLQLGKFKGTFNHDIAVDKWESGVYLVHITHGDEEMIEKLIVK